MFSPNVLTANLTYYRTYSRKRDDGKRENWKDTCERTVRKGLKRVGSLTDEETNLIYERQLSLKALTSGRWLWVGGTEFIEVPKNFYAAYNCCGLLFDDLKVFDQNQNYLMMGDGVGTLVDINVIKKLPPITATLDVIIKTHPGGQVRSQDKTHLEEKETGLFSLTIGDSREGWVQGNAYLKELATTQTGKVTVNIYLDGVRGKGQKIKGFGGSTNPDLLGETYIGCSKILNKVLNRQLTSVEVIKLMGLDAKLTVAGNVRRSAKWNGLDEEDKEGKLCKQDLWKQTPEGEWQIDPDKDPLRYANHSIIYKRKPSLEEVVELVTQNYFSGEGALWYAPEAIARANADLWSTKEEKSTLIKAALSSDLSSYLKLKVQQIKPNLTEENLEKEVYHRSYRYVANPCGEIVGMNFLCNLGEAHLNNHDPQDLEDQLESFRSVGLSIATLLNHNFDDPKMAYSRELDPIVGGSFTGLFDFFVHAFGVSWLKWWEQGRPKFWDDASNDDYYKLTQCTELLGISCYDEQDGAPYDCAHLYKEVEKAYLTLWRNEVEKTVYAYCDKHNLKRPNRCTTVQPAGCLTADAVRVFDQGLLFADEHMKPGQGEVGLDLFGLTVRNGITTTTGIANAPLPLIKITLANGRHLTMTPNHRLSIADEWVAAEEMIPGMEIDFAVGQYKNDKEAPLVPIEVKPNRLGRPVKGCKLPSVISPDLAYFIGALYGNGCTSEQKYRVRFSHGRLDILNRLDHIGQNLFGLSGSIYMDKRGGRHELVFANKQLYHFLKANGLAKGCKSKELQRMPQVIRMSSQESILAFIAGLIDTDGSVRQSGSVAITSASETFLRHIQQIAEAVGLSFSIGLNSAGSNHQEEKAMWHLTMSRMVSLPQAISVINRISTKAQERPIPTPIRTFQFTPYQVLSVEWVKADYTYDYAINGQDYNDSWYWQGALMSHNTKSLLSGASPGWHPPKAQRFIRRITFEPYNPVAMAALDMGYSVVPGQKDTDESGVLLSDPYDSRVTEWLVEVPVEVSWANLPGADQIKIENFSACAQLDFYMQVQNHYTRHNTSATIEFRQDEIPEVANFIHEAIEEDRGYISVALLARFDDLETFPRLPFEPINQEKYEEILKEVESRRVADSFELAMAIHDSEDEAGPQDLACSGTSCEIKFAVTEKPQVSRCDLNFGDEADLDDCGCPTA